MFVSPILPPFAHNMQVIPKYVVVKGISEKNGSRKELEGGPAMRGAGRKG
jgi:hypothetical protein